MTAKRWASSRMRWSSSSDGWFAASAIGLGAVARHDELLLLREADGHEVREAEFLQRA